MNLANTRTTSANTRKKDARHLYIWFSLHLACRNLDASQLLIAATETNFLARDVMRNAPLAIIHACRVE